MAGNKHAGEVTQEIVGWIADLAEGVSVSAAAMSQEPAPEGIEVRLIGGNPRAVPRAPGRKSAVLALDYLVTLRFADPITEHKLWSDLAFAAIDTDLVELATDRAVDEVCRALGLKPGCALLLRAEARHDVVLPRAPLVRHPPLTTVGELYEAEGIVAGPDGTPISGALVILDGSNRTALTGADGRFRFAVPAGSTATASARSRAREVTAPLEAGAPTTLTLPMEA